MLCRNGFFAPIILHRTPLLPCPCSLAAAYPLSRTLLTVIGPIAARYKGCAAGCALLYARMFLEDLSAKQLVIGENGIAKPFAVDGIGNPLRADVAKSPIKEQTVPLIVVAALVLYQPSCLPELTFIHSGQISHCQTPA